MSGKQHILLVDDEDGIRRVLGLVLKDFGYTVSTAPGGHEALAALAAMPADALPDIVLTDIKMPGLDGLGLLKAVKELYPELEVIMLTGHGDMDLAVASLRHGAGDFLNKPVSDDALEVALQRAAERREMRAALRRYSENLEQLVEQRTRELIEAERFAAVGETAASLAHSIKNIAGALEGTMYVLEKGLKLDRREYFEEGWQMVRGDVARLKALALGLLDLGSSEKIRPVPGPAARPLEEVAVLLRARAAEGGVRLEVSIDAPGKDFLLDAEAVHQCLFNLALNAVEAVSGRSGAAVWLSCELAKNGNASVLRYSVRDNGPGLPPAIASGEHFGFASTKASGSGIGLFSTRKLARAMGAELRFESGEQGTIACLELAVP